MDLVSRLQEVLKRKEELERRREEVLNEMSKLKPEKGSLEYKYVINKVGKRYYYWYLRKWENGRLRSIYLGSSVPDSLIKSIKDRKKLRELQRELRAIEYELRKIQNAIYSISNILSSL